jgi:hypothetical protein
VSVMASPMGCAGLNQGVGTTTRFCGLSFKNAPHLSSRKAEETSNVKMIALEGARAQTQNQTQHTQHVPRKRGGAHNMGITRRDSRQIQYVGEGCDTLARPTVRKQRRESARARERERARARGRERARERGRGRGRARGRGREGLREALRGWRGGDWCARRCLCVRACLCTRVLACVCEGPSGWSNEG